MSIYKQSITLRALLCAAIILSLGETAQALNPSRQLSQYVQTRRTFKDGLPQGPSDILQDHRGYLWITTQEGLARFDGSRFVKFDKKNTPQMPSNTLNVIFEDSNRLLWIGTEGDGLYSLDENGVITTYGAAEGLTNGNVSGFAMSGDGSLWVATLGAGLFLLEGAGFTPFGKNDALLSLNIHEILFDRSGRLLVGTDAGLNIVSLDAESTIQSFTKDNDVLPDNRVHALHQDKQGRTWIGTESGLCLFQSNTCRTYTSKDGLSDPHVKAIATDRDGTLWVGGRNNGVSLFKGERFYADERAVGVNKEIMAITEDVEGNIWVATGGGGMSQFSDGQFTTVAPFSELTKNGTWAVIQDREGTVWMGGNSGLVGGLDQQEYQFLSTDQGLPHSVVTGLALPNRGAGLWVGTNGGGVARLKRGQVTSVIPADALPDGKIRHLHEDAQGHLWIGTSNAGLVKWGDGRVLKHWDEKSPLKSNRVVLIAPDKTKNRLLVAGYSGLFALENDQLTALLSPGGQKQTPVLTFYQDPAGNFFVGTLGQGLFFSDSPGKFHQVDQSLGLFDEKIFSIIEDASGYLWMSSNNGISRVRKTDLIAAAKGQIERFESVVFTEKDGMKSRECSGGVNPSAWRDTSGRIWYANVSGAVMTDPSSIVRNLLPPPTVVETAMGDGHRLVAGAPVPAGTERFVFDFTALTFIASEHTNFIYKLEGFDSTWLSGQGQLRQAHYTNIPPGKYSFQVKAQSADGIWSVQAGTFPFELEAFFWQTRWFIFICLLLSAALVWRMAAWRAKSQRQRELRMNELAWERTKQVLKSQVGAIRGVTTKVSNVSEVLKDTVSKLSSSAEEVAASVSETASTVSQIERSGELNEDNAAKIVTASAKRSNEARLGYKSVQKSLQLIEEIQDQSIGISDKTTSLLKGLAEVDTITETVKTISDRSKILAINASIEAAKADKEGAGFSVVARRMKELALQSREATLHIAGLLNGIKKSVRQIAQMADDGRQRTESGVESMVHSGNVVNNLRGGMEENSDLADVIAGSIEQQLVGLKYIVSGIEQMNSTVRENAAASSRVDHSAGELTDAVHELTELIDNWQTPESFIVDDEGDSSAQQFHWLKDMLRRD